MQEFKSIVFICCDLQKWFFLIIYERNDLTFLCVSKLLYFKDAWDQEHIEHIAVRKSNGTPAIQ